MFVARFLLISAKIVVVYVTRGFPKMSLLAQAKTLHRNETCFMGCCGWSLTQKYQCWHSARMRQARPDHAFLFNRLSGALEKVTSGKWLGGLKLQQGEGWRRQSKREDLLILTGGCFFPMIFRDGAGEMRERDTDWFASRTDPTGSRE